MEMDRPPGPFRPGRHLSAPHPCPGPRRGGAWARPCLRTGAGGPAFRRGLRRAAALRDGPPSGDGPLPACRRKGVRFAHRPRGGAFRSGAPPASPHPWGNGPPLFWAGGGLAVAFRVRLGQPLRHGGGKARVGQSRDGGAAPAQGPAQLRLGKGKRQMEAVALFRQVLRPAEGVPRRVGAAQQQPRLSGLGGQGRGLLTHNQPPAPEGQPQKGQHVVSAHVPPPSSASMAS